MWQHVDKVKAAIERPEIILKGMKGELIAVKRFQELLGGSSLVVVYRTINEKGFIITAFPTKRLDRLYMSREVVWRQKK